jgi:hypothetical protein
MSCAAAELGWFADVLASFLWGSVCSTHAQGGAEDPANLFVDC